MENFVIRRITSDGRESNTIIGEDYNILHSEDDAAEFNSTLELMGMNPDDKEECYAVLIYKDGSVTMPLYKKSTYYVMTTDGNTFANATYR